MKIELYQTSSKASPVEKFVSDLDKPTQARVIRSLELVERYSSDKLGSPHIKSLKRGLFEIRIFGRQSVRLLFCYHLGSIVLLHGFVKKSQHTPSKEINLALKRKAKLTKI